MLVSVAIPAYNQADYLREAIESAVAQTYRPLEIIVVDDGSTDHTRDVCLSFENKIRYIYQENDGTYGAGARNRAILESSGEWVALLDHDDTWQLNKLEAQLNAAQRYPGVYAVFTESDVMDADGEIIKSSRAWTGNALYTDARQSFHKLLTANVYSASSGLFKRQFLSEHGLPNPRTVGCGDWDLWLSISRKYPVAVIDAPLTKYRVFSGQFGSNKKRLGIAMTETLLKFKNLLHPNCPDCLASYKEAEVMIKSVFSQAAVSFLDRYHTEMAAGNIQRALPSLKEAFQISPKEVLFPHRFLAICKKLVLFPMALARTRGKRSNISH